MTVAGEAGSILTLACGDGPERDPGGLLGFGEAMEALADEVDEALLWDTPDGCDRWKLRTDDTDDEVDLRRPKPDRRR